MTLLTDIRDFLLRERGWTILFLCLVAIYALVAFWPGEKAEETSSEAVERLRLAEQELKEEIQTKGGFDAFLAERPDLYFTFYVFTLFVLGAFLAGLGVDLAWILRSDWRARFRVTPGAPEAASWGLGSVFKAILLFVAASLLLSAFLSALKVLFFDEASPNFFVLIHTNLSDLLVLGFVLYFVTQRGGQWRQLGFGKVSFWRDLAAGLVGYLGVVPLFMMTLIAVALLAQLFAYEPPPHPLVEILLEEEARAPGLVAYSIFLACVAGPFFEEIFFRGFCYPAFKKRWGAGWALFLSSAFFGFIHQNIFAFLPIFVLGLGLGYLYEKRGSLVPSIALHIFHNTIFLSYFFLAKQVLSRI